MSRLNSGSEFHALNFASIPQKPTNGLCMKYIVLLELNYTSDSSYYWNLRGFSHNLVKFVNGTSRLA